MAKTPFESKDEICCWLKAVGGELKVQQDIGKDGNKQKTPVNTLPGDPRIELTDPKIGEHLEAEFITKDLDKLAPHLWLMTTPSSDNISSLTEQAVRGRKPVVTENPGLHLVWIRNRVFLKPLPRYLLSHAFWDHFLVSAESPIEVSLRRDVMRAARGFMRTYKYLIKHESDFDLATQGKTRLVPTDIEYAEFVKFINLCDIEDDSVSPRYRKSGELRLTRLNFWSKIFLQRINYHKVEWQYGAYFAQYYAPILFIFAVFSLVMSAMQLTLAVRGVLEPKNDAWLDFARVARGFALFTIVGVACVIASLLFILAVFIVREVVFALKAQLRRTAHGDQESAVKRTTRDVGSEEKNPHTGS